MSKNNTDRWGLVDGPTAYYHRIVKSGDLLFLSGTGFGGDGAPLPASRVEFPYTYSGPAHIEGQTLAIFGEYKKGLPEFGSSLDDVVQIEQYIPHKEYGDGYVNTSRGPGLLEHKRPTSALMTTGDLIPAECVIAQTSIGIAGSASTSKEVYSLPDYAASITDESYMASMATEPPFNQVATAGNYFFTVGDIAIDWEAGAIPDSVKVNDFVFWGNEMRNEAEFLLDRLEVNLAMVDASVRDITQVTSYVATVSDVYELDEAWRRRLGDGTPPARTIIPVRTQGTPRLEAENQTHADNAVRIEQITQGVRVQLGARREAISTPFAPLGYESVAMRGENHVWVSGQYGFPGKAPEPITTDTGTQAATIFDRFEAILESAGTSLGELGRVRIYLADIRDHTKIVELLRERFGARPPACVISGARSPMLVPGATVFMDGIAHVE